MTDFTDGVVRLYYGLGAVTSKSTPHKPSELVDATGRRITLVVSDCVSLAWRNGSMAAILAQWQRSGPLAIVQMLPEHLWDATGLGDAVDADLKAGLPGALNNQLRCSIQDPWHESQPTDLPVPIIQLNPQSLRDWTTLVMGSARAQMVGRVFQSQEKVAEPITLAVSEDITPARRVANFRALVSRRARQLAGVLAIIPVLTLPLMRVVQATLLPDSDESHLAELFIGGILREQEDAHLREPESVQYTFVSGVSDLLIKSVSSYDAITALSLFVERHLGRPINFFALVEDPSRAVGLLGLGEESEAFAELTSEALRRLGGSFARVAAELEKLSQGPRRTKAEKVLTSTANPIHRNINQLRYAQKMFIGHERQLADFRASVSYLLKKAARPTGDFFPHLFIAYGEGGMGKTTLLHRWLEVAREEGIPAERIIAIDLDYNSYLSHHDLANKIITDLSLTFPGFDRGYRDVIARLQALRGRHDELYDQWERWQAHVENGTTDELIHALTEALARAEAEKAKYGDSLDVPITVNHMIVEAQEELRMLRNFAAANSQSSQTFTELLERELGEDAALFDPATSAKALGNDIYELAEQQPLVLALDTYELADHYHNWLIDLYFEAGDQMLLLLSGRNAVHRGDYHERCFSGKLRPLVQAYDLGKETFSTEEIRQFVAQTLGAEPNDADVARIEQTSRGVPLAVEALAGALKDNGDLRMYAGLDTRSAARNEIIRKVLNRFMRYTIADRQRDSTEDTARKQADRAAIRGLALLLRPEPELICALWGCDNQTVERRISDLGVRHSFVFARAGSFELHDLVRQFIREDLWHTKTNQFEWALLRDGLHRVLVLVESRLARYLTRPHEESYNTAAFHEAVLDRLNLLLWLDELDEAKRWLLNRWLEARQYHRKLADDLQQLLTELTPKQRSWHNLKQLFDRKDGVFDFPAFTEFVGLLEPHPHLIYLESINTSKH
jgi:GTPase SAR1 family protein